MISVLCFAADALSPGNWFTLFKVLTLNAGMWTIFLHQSNFCLSLSSIADFSNTWVRALTSVEHAPCLPMQRVMQFGHMVWIRVLVIFCWLFLCFFINRHHSYRLVAVVSWLNYLILAIDLWSSFAQHLVKVTGDPTLNSSTLLNIRDTPFHGFQWYKKGGVHIKFVKF